MRRGLSGWSVLRVSLALRLGRTWKSTSRKALYTWFALPAKKAVP